MEWDIDIGMRFEDLHAWQRARVLTNAVHTLRREKSLSADFGLRNQIQRAAASAMRNIALRPVGR